MTHNYKKSGKIRNANVLEVDIKNTKNRNLA